MTMTDDLRISLLRLDGGTQSRAVLDEETIAEYAAAMERGDEFPPVIAFYDGETYWLCDGFHRIAAAKRIDRQTFAVDVRQGGQRDAVLFSTGVNATHGLRRSNDDKRRAVLVLLRDEEWGQWSNREIARRARVSDPFVGKLRAELAAESPASANVSSAQRKFQRDGETRTMDTNKIGRSKPASAGTSAQAAGSDEPAAPSAGEADDEDEGGFDRLQATDVEGDDEDEVPDWLQPDDTEADDKGAGILPDTLSQAETSVEWTAIIRFESPAGEAGETVVRLTLKRGVEQIAETTLSVAEISERLAALISENAA